MTKRARCQPLITGLWEPSLGSRPAPRSALPVKWAGAYPGSDNHYTQAKPLPKKLPKFVIRYKELLPFIGKISFSFSVAPNTCVIETKQTRKKPPAGTVPPSLFASSNACVCKDRTNYPFTQMQKVQKEPRRALFLIANRFSVRRGSPRAGWR